MKKWILILSGLATVGGTPSAFAVWPPANTEEQVSPQAPQDVRTVLDKLTEDERRCAEILRDLRADEAKLRQITEKLDGWQATAAQEK